MTPEKKNTTARWPISRRLPIFAAVALALILVIFAGRGLFTPTASQMDDRRLLVAAMSTATGPTRLIGGSSRAALEIAQEEINKSGGVLLADGKRATVDIEFHEDHCNAEEGQALIRRIAGGEWIAVVGPTCSNVAEPVYRLLQARVRDNADLGLRIPVITDVAMRPGLAAISDWAFRNVVSERDMYAAFFAWLKSARPELTTMAGCWDDDVAHSRSVWRRVVKSAAQAAGFSLQSEIKWHANAAEIEAAAKTMARSGAQVGVISAHAASACAFLRELVKEPSRPSVLIGLDSVASLEFLKDCPKEAEGLLVPTSFAPINADTERFAQEMSRRGATADMHSAAAYEILHALRRVAEGQRVHARQHAVDADRRRVRDGLGALESFDGLLGRVRLTPEGEALKPMVFVEAKDGRWRLRHRIDP